MKSGLWLGLKEGKSDIIRGRYSRAGGVRAYERDQTERPQSVSSTLTDDNHQRTKVKAQTKSAQSVIYEHSNCVLGQFALTDALMPTPDLPTVDVDLQDLYDQVLSGFNDDTFPELPTPIAQNKASPSDLESLYSSYAEDTTDPSSKLARNLSYTVASQRTQTSAQSRPIHPDQCTNPLISRFRSAIYFYTIPRSNSKKTTPSYPRKFLLIPNLQHVWNAGGASVSRPFPQSRLVSYSIPLAPFLPIVYPSTSIFLAPGRSSAARTVITTAEVQQKTIFP